MKINSSQVAYSSQHQRESSEQYERSIKSEVVTNTPDSASTTNAALFRNATSGNTELNIGINPSTQSVVDLSYKARMYSQQSTQADSYSLVTSATDQLSLQKSLASQSVVQEVIGMQASVRNLSINENQTELLNPLQTAAYKNIELQQTEQTTQLNMNSTDSSEQARLEIKEQYTLIEKEKLQLGAQGRVTTSDGREIDFMLKLEMQRNFQLEESLHIKSEQRELMDPLVINFDAGAASLTSGSFSFDLNADGISEEISFVGQGSGFLAIDSNDDGRINDGSELFGTGELGGFAQLAEHDLDNNKWIDENDAIFEKLKIWTKDENGVDQLTGLKEAGVGAIYLGASVGSFDLTDTSNNLLGQVKRSGIYLTEAGEVASIQELDIAIRNTPQTSRIEQSLEKIDTQVQDWEAENVRPEPVFTIGNLGAAPVAAEPAEENKLLTLLDMLFPKPGSKYYEEAEKNQQSISRESSTSTTMTSNSSEEKTTLEEKEETTKKIIENKNTIDVLARLQRQTVDKLNEEDGKYAHLRAIIESLVKSNQQIKVSTGS
ncbi:MAG: hypothetical protein ACI9ES_002289 [Oceanospirillaceae bacterium]